MIKNIFVLLRIKDWLKNIVIFFPILFSSQLFQLNHYSSLLFGFFSFCILSSFIYVLNDIIDIEKDKNHPIKSTQKPLANEKIKIQIAYLILVIFFLIALTFTVYFPALRLNLFLYFLLSLMYNFGVKKLPYIEIVVLSLGYVVRTDCGSRIISVESSILMLLAVFCIGIFFILLKRLSELNLNIDLLNKPTRNVLRYYNKSIIKFFVFLSFLAISLIFIIYITLVNHLLILCFALILIFLLRFFFLVKDTYNAENPISFILSNKFLLIISVFIFLSSLIIYL